jgi:very-short-patch-repair endonuclease
VAEHSPILRRLCNYYLACLANDDAGGVSVPVRSSGEPEYVELANIELDGARLPGWNEKLSEFVAGRRAREAGMLRLGYPVLMLQGRPDGGGRKLLPLFLIDVSADPQGIEPDWRTCVLNLEAVRELEGNGVAFAQHVVTELEEGLGLDVNGEVKAFADIVERLKLMRPDWPWADPESEQTPPQPLPSAPAGLIYERAIVMRVSRPFTQGLELELQKLAQIPEHELFGTALGALLFGEQATRPRDPDTTPLLEVLPMNPEQRATVKMALTEPLSVITGPPGTGKSQVVANLLVNCTWRKRPVIFTSKNNKAVDVVDSRVNGLGRKPVMVRLGAKEHRHKLAEHLAHLIEGTVTPEDLEELRREQGNYRRLGEELAEVDEAERATLELHEQALHLAEQLTDSGQTLSPERLAAARKLDIRHARTLLFAARDAYLEALPSRHPAWVRFLWRWIGMAKEAVFTRAMATLSRAMGSFLIGKSPDGAPAMEPAEWKEYLVAQSRSLVRAERLLVYAAALKSLRDVKLGELAARRNTLQGQLVETSSALWQRWVAAQPALIKSDQRLMLSRYSAVLKSVVEAGSADALPDAVRREYERITLEAPDVVSCFAVTALSARNRVPFTPGFFDLVVFDESSQCDLASALPILFRAKRAVIIGDPKQLQHISSLRRDRDASFLVDQKLEKTHLDWQYSTQSLFSLVSSRVLDSQKMSLRDHHRSHPDVIGYSNEAFYSDSLRIVTMLPALKRFTPTGPAVRWIDVRGRAQRGNRGSVHNPEEAAVIVNEVRRIVKSGYTGTLGVVTPFTYQAERIRRDLERDPALWEKLRIDHDFQSATAHGFQGDERDLMLFSVVAGQGLHDGAVQFLEDESHVFNVAITRARAELVVVGDFAYCVDTPVTHLKGFARYVSELQRLEVSEPSTGVQVAAQGVATPEETRLTEALKGVGLKPSARMEIEQYKVDIVLMDGDRKLAIDVMDRTAPGDYGAEALEREQLKRQRLLKLGWSVMRFWPIQVKDDLPWCVSQVREWVKASKTPEA